MCYRNLCSILLLCYIMALQAIKAVALFPYQALLFLAAVEI